MSAVERWTHWLAITLVVVTLALPVMMGSLTTTLGAGMAFLDWPTSDGENMLFYDIFRDIREGNTDKVAEHGHRLAGMIVGMLSIPLAILGWWDRRPGVRTLTLMIFLGVVAQGVLGGMRVRLDARVLAMIHSICAALLVVVMGVTAMVTSKQWGAWDESVPRVSRFVVTLATIVPLLVIIQYVAGGMIRHFGTAIPEHLGGAILVGGLSIAVAMAALQTGIRHFISLAWFVFAAVFFQIMLGLGAWAGKYGLAAFGVVAVERGVLQVTLRTLHTAGGMVLLMASSMLAVAVWRAAWGLKTARARVETPEHVAMGRVSGSKLAGGAR